MILLDTALILKWNHGKSFFFRICFCSSFGETNRNNKIEGEINEDECSARLHLDLFSFFSLSLYMTPCAYLLVVGVRLSGLPYACEWVRLVICLCFDRWVILIVWTSQQNIQAMQCGAAGETGCAPLMPWFTGCMVKSRHTYTSSLPYWGNNSSSGDSRAISYGHEHSRERTTGCAALKQLPGKMLP